MDKKTSHTPAIEIRKLVKEYPGQRRLIPALFHPGRNGGVRALDEVDLEVREGEIMGLLGTNGAGKTTLIKIVCNLLLPTSGRVMVWGHDSVREERTIREFLGLVVSDERSFYWRLTPRRNLEFFASLYGLSQKEAGKRIGELGEMLHMGDFLDKPFSDLSSGMRQKVAIARGLLHHPKVLLMDEPTRSLSPEAALEIDQLLLRILKSQEERSMLFASQNMEEVERICDRVCLLHQGRLLFVGTVTEFKKEALLRGGAEEMHLDELFSVFLKGREA